MNAGEVDAFAQYDPWACLLYTSQRLYESCGFANCGVYEDFYPHLGRAGVLYEFAL